MTTQQEVIDKAQAFVAKINSNFNNIQTKKGTVASFSNPALTCQNSVCSWSITHNLDTENIICAVYDVSTGKEVLKDTQVVSENIITVKINAAANIAQDTYNAVIIGV